MSETKTESLTDSQKVKVVWYALEGIMSLGRKDTTNPKYDGYYEEGSNALALYDPSDEYQPITADKILEIVKEALPDAQISDAECVTLKSMFAEYIDTEDWRPGKAVCDFLGVDRRYNATEIDNRIFDYLKLKKVLE